MLDVETGMVPVNLLSAKSSQYKLERVPREGGISPLKLFELRALPKVVEEGTSMKSDKFR